MRRKTGLYFKPLPLSELKRNFGRVFSDAVPNVFDKLNAF